MPSDFIYLNWREICSQQVYLAKIEVELYIKILLCLEFNGKLGPIDYGNTIL